MSLGPASSVKLASLTERSAKRPCSDWHGIPWLCCVRPLPSSPSPLLAFSKSEKISTPSNTPHPRFFFFLPLLLLPLSSEPRSVASGSQRGLFVIFFFFFFFFFQVVCCWKQHSGRRKNATSAKSAQSVSCICFVSEQIDACCFRERMSAFCSETRNRCADEVRPGILSLGWQHY